MFSPIGKAILLANTPAGRRAIRQAIALARSEEARRLAARAHELATGPEGKKLIGHARNAARRPRISETIDQPPLVRPRIPAKVVAPGVAR